MLRDKVALVTGSSRGIGWATACRMAELGAHVIVNGRSDPERLEARAAELRERFGVEASALQFDVADADAVQAAYQQVFKRWRRLDVLVNNAGILDDQLVGMITGAHVDRTLSVNVRGVILNLQAGARLMMRAGRGSIVNLTSIIGTHGNAGQVVYGASKSAVIGVTRSAAKELAPRGIRVNAVAPGYIATDMIAHLSPEIHAARMASIGLGRVGQPAEVAEAIAWLSSDLAGYVTGQVLGVDGGMLI